MTMDMMQRQVSYEAVTLNVILTGMAVFPDTPANGIESGFLFAVRGL